MGDLDIVQEKIPLREEDFPVAVTRADERKRAGASVGHISADIEKIFEKLECAEGGAGGFATKEEIYGAGERDDQFEKRAAHDHERVAETGFGATTENAEERMASFVDGEIGEIEEEEAGAVVCGVSEEEEIERECDDGDGARDGFPGIE